MIEQIASSGRACPCNSLIVCKPCLLVWCREARERAPSRRVNLPLLPASFLSRLGIIIAYINYAPLSISIPINLLLSKIAYTWLPSLQPAPDPPRLARLFVAATGLHKMLSEPNLPNQNPLPKSM
jgi:hypothetical protein